MKKADVFYGFAVLLAVIGICGVDGWMEFNTGLEISIMMFIGCGVLAFIGKEIEDYDRKRS